MYKNQNLYNAPESDNMEKITYHVQSNKTKDDIIKVRFRLTDGRAVQMTHKTDITCTVDELKMFNPNGSLTSTYTNYNRSLASALKKEYAAMTSAYDKMCDEGLDKTSEVWEREIAAIKNPVQAIRQESPSIVDRFRKYADGSLNAGIIGENRYKHIIVVSDKLERFLIIKGISAITAEEFDIDHLMDFRQFLFDEYLYIKKYPKLYAKVKEQNKPKIRLSMNTVTSQLKMFQTFFTELEDTDEIRKSPFRKMGKEKRKAVMRTKYDDPYFLRKEELETLLNAEVPENLEDTRNAFLVQCAFGCRISDFTQMSMATIAVSEDGIPYVHYIPKKTADAQEGNEEIQTPIVRYALDIIKKTDFHFPILNNIFGSYGYNAKIKTLLKHCGIDRLVAQYNEQKKTNEYLPLHEVGSSKLARKTHVDMMTKVQVNQYAAGLHKVGSSAVNRYTAMELKDRFALMNAAFGQEPYKVDESFNIIN